MSKREIVSIANLMPVGYSTSLGTATMPSSSAFEVDLRPCGESVEVSIGIWVIESTFLTSEVRGGRSESLISSAILSEKCDFFFKVRNGIESH